jgi:hypothetical protein
MKSRYDILVKVDYMRDMDGYLIVITKLNESRQAVQECRSEA